MRTEARIARQILAVEHQIQEQPPEIRRAYARSLRILARRLEYATPPDKRNVRDYIRSLLPPEDCVQ